MQILAQQLEPMTMQMQAVMDSPPVHKELQDMAEHMQTAMARSNSAPIMSLVRKPSGNSRISITTTSGEISSQLQIEGFLKKKLIQKEIEYMKGMPAHVRLEASKFGLMH